MIIIINKFEDYYTNLKFSIREGNRCQNIDLLPIQVSGCPKWPLSWGQLLVYNSLTWQYNPTLMLHSEEHIDFSFHKENVHRPKQSSIQGQED